MTENKHGFMPKQEIKIGRIAFTIIQTAESWVKCITSEFIDNGAFDTKNRNDFATSDIREFLNGEFLQKLIEAGAPEAMFEYFNVDLTADDGLKDYGGDRVRVGLITCDEYRLLRDNIPELSGTWWWTATPDSPKNNSVQFVDSDGTLNSVNACYGFYGVRPLCVLKSEILKSYLDGDEKKRAEAVDTMKHIAAAWNIKPEEVFIPEIEKVKASFKLEGEENKIGRWELDAERSKWCMEKIYVCSNCKTFEAWGEFERTNYCPYCGARMEK